MSENCLARNDELADGVQEKSSTSYTTRASELTRTGAALPVAAPGSRRDFLRAVQLLGGGLNVRKVRGKRDLFEVVPVHLSCPHETWVKVFGEVRGPEEQETAAGNPGVHVWEHPCADGRVTCIGHLFERSPGVPWVVLVRVCLPRAAA